MDIARIAFIAAFSFFIHFCQSEKKDQNHVSPDFRNITYNVWYGFSKVPDRKETWIEWMNEQDPDVVSLQELNGYTEQKLAEDAESYGHTYSALLKEEGFPTGITSRYPIEDVQRITEGFHHGLLRVRIQGIYIFVIHLHPSNWESRKAEIDQMLQNVDELPADSKVILAGDFNTFSPLDSVYYTQDSLEAFFKNRDTLYREKYLDHSQLDYSVIQKVMDFGFIDIKASLRDTAYTFSGSFPTMLEKEDKHGDQRRLDFIFTSENRAKKVTRVEIIATDTTLILSDHLPLMVDMDLEELKTIAK